MKVTHCPEHPARWSTHCQGCRDARATTLATLQSCRVHGSEQCFCTLLDLAADLQRRNRRAA